MKARLVAALIVSIGLISGPGLAERKIGGDGPASNMEYRYVSTETTGMGALVTLAFDNVSVILHRQDLGRIYFLPGMLVRAENTTRQPLCFAFHFVPPSWEMTHWGSDEVRYLSAHQRTGYIAGVYMRQDGRGSVGFLEARIHTWAPVGKGQCGSDPQG